MIRESLPRVPGEDDRPRTRFPNPPSDFPFHLENTASKTPHHRGRSQDDVALLGLVWYLSYVGPYHPRKPGQIRVAFKRSVELFRGRSRPSLSAATVQRKL